jgi:hypothetical protein
VLETENKQLVEEKKIHEDKCSKMKKEMREKLLKRVGTFFKNFNTNLYNIKKLQESQDKFDQNIASLEEKYQKENAELKVLFKRNCKQLIYGQFL